VYRDDVILVMETRLNRDIRVYRDINELKKGC